jgi:enoyl-CoA hydratase/3-hydroxyacyl-CoA dehydrogenase
MDASTAADLGLLTHLVDVSGVNACVAELAKNGKPVNKYPGSPANPESAVATFSSSFFADKNMVDLMAGTCPTGFDAEDRNVSRQLKSLSRTAPIALSMASALIDESANTTLSQGLQLELDRLTEIFSTADSLEGLSALIEGRKPTYSNA